jgi:hypothetical protein
MVAGSNNGLSPMKFEKQYYENIESVQKTRGVPLAQLDF